MKIQASIRIDYLPAQRITIFGRYSNAPSRTSQRGGGGNQYANIKNFKYGTQVLTIGSNQALSPAATNEVRGNYSSSTGKGFYTLDTFGGATAPPDSVLYPSFVAPQDAGFLFNADATPNGIKFSGGKLGGNWQPQINVTDNLSRMIGAHQMKVGVDYRRINSKTGFYAY